MSAVIGDVLLDSLQRRMHTMHDLYYQAVSTMDLEHVNHFEREGVLPIAFSLFHYTNMQDASFMLITGIPPIWNDEWQARVGMTINDHGKHRTVDEMIHQRIGDYEAFKEYQRTVFDRTRRGSLTVAGRHRHDDFDDAVPLLERSIQVGRMSECAVAAGGRIEDQPRSFHVHSNRPIGPRSRLRSSGERSNWAPRSRMVSSSRMSAVPTASVSSAVSVFTGMWT